jgi:hypothetical protein
MPLKSFQGLHNATFGIPILGTMTRTHCVRQTQLLRTPAALRSPEVVLLSLNIGRDLPIQLIPSDVFLNICELITFLLMRHPYSGFTSTLLSCSTSFTPVTDGHQMSAQIITFVVMCYNSQLTLHYTAVINLNKEMFSLHQTSPLAQQSQYLATFSVTNNIALYEIFYHVATV